MRTLLCFLCYTKRDKRASIRIDNATCNLLFFFFSFLFSLRFSIVNTNLFREPDRFVFVILLGSSPTLALLYLYIIVLPFSYPIGSSLTRLLLGSLYWSSCYCSYILLL